VAKLLRWLVVTMGVACTAIGLYHIVFGIGSVPGEGSGNSLSGATVDSRERFYNAIFFGYGVVWLWAGRQSPIPAKGVRWLAGFMLLGGIGRIISVMWYGWPHWFQVVLTVIELGLPPLYFWLADADEKAATARAGRA
jgi:Domain of unknown function (DUF4345)